MSRALCQRRFAAVPKPARVGRPRGRARPSVATFPDRLRTIEPLVNGTTAPTRTLKLMAGMSLRRGLDFRVNGERHHHDAPVKVGELQVWDVKNVTLMDHPFHLHGFFFITRFASYPRSTSGAWIPSYSIPSRRRVPLCRRSPVCSGLS